MHNPSYIVGFKPRQKTIQDGVIRNRAQSQSGTQLGVLAEPNFGLSKGPVFVAHQAEHGKRLRLPEQPLAEFRAPRGQYWLANFESQTGKPNQSNFGHP
jgi:hypothetical protein